MNDHQLLRYSRHILLDEIGTEAAAGWAAPPCPIWPPPAWGG